MDILNKISSNEYDMINNWIVQNLEENANWATRKTDMKYILRFWAKAKSMYLEKIFGENLILSKPISFKKEIDELSSEIEKTIFNRYRCSDGVTAFIDSFYNLVDSVRGTAHCWIEPADLRVKKVSDNLSMFLWTTVLASNTFEGETFELKNPKAPDKPLKFQHGCKISKALGKIAEAYDLPGYEEFRIEHSRCLNQKTSHGTLCLSIHPLDYMTMSDNGYDWTSCMSWNDQGCYRQGTVEMMNSPMVVVAYLDGDDDFYLGRGEKWSNKKWRELFIITPDIITNVKGYPYKNSQLSDTVIKWLKALAEKAEIGTYSDNIYPYSIEDRITIPELGIERVEFDPRTEVMYNDFSTDQRAVFGSTFNSFNNDLLEINYSGESECMCCGEIEDFYEFSGRLVGECCLEVHYCDECGEEFYSTDELCEIDDCLLCPNCYDEYVREDPFTGELHLERNMTRLMLAKENDEGQIILLSVEEISVYNLDECGDKLLKEYFSEIHKIDSMRYCGYFIFPEKLTEKGARVFGYSTKERLLESVSENNARSNIVINPGKIFGKGIFGKEEVKDLYDFTHKYHLWGSNSDTNHWIHKTNN